MKMFKRMLSLLLMLSLVITSPVLVTAEESGETETKFSDTITYTDIVMDTPQTVTITKEVSCQYFRFVPEKTGEYVIYSTMTEETGDPYVELYNAEGEFLDSDDDDDSGLNFDLSRELQEGTEYFIKGRSLGSSEVSYQICVVQKKTFAELKEAAVDLILEEGGTQSETISVNTVGENKTTYDQLISFTPAEDGHYVVGIETDHYLTGKLVILDSEGTVCSNMEAYSQWNEDKICYYVQGYLAKGVNYYIGIDYQYVSGCESYSCEAWVKKEKTVSDIKVELVSENAALVYGRAGYWDEYYNETSNEYVEYYCYEREDILGLFKITIVYDDDTEEIWDGSTGGRITYQHSSSAQAQWSVGGTDNLITLVADKCTKQVNVPIVAAPTATSLEITLMSPESCLVYEKDGEWYEYETDDMGTTSEYFHFYVSTASSIFYAKVTYEDGSFIEGPADELYYDQFISCSSNQSASNPWVVDGTNNLLIFTVDECTQQVNVPVVAPIAVSSLEVEIADQNAYLIYGDEDEGYWNGYYDSTSDSYKEYFYFYNSNVRNLFNVKITYADGTVVEGNLNEKYYDSWDIRCVTNQSSTEPWLPDGGTHTLTVTVRDVSKTVNVPIRESAVTDFVAVESISLGSNLTVTAGESQKFTPVFTPASATLDGIYWESENTGIAQVSKTMSNGMITVTGIAQGTTNIVAYAANGARLATFAFTVVKKQTTDNNTVTATKEIAEVTLVKDSVTYNGKAQKPAVVVKDNSGNVMDKANYTVTYKNNKNVGVATVTVTASGNYKGEVSKTFKIVPKGTAIKKIVAKKKGFSLKWKKQATQVTGYEIQYSLQKSFKKASTKKIKKAKTTNVTISKLKANKKYYVRIRTYKNVKVNGKTVKLYSTWSKPKTIKTKK